MRLLEYHPRSIFLKEAESGVEKYFDLDEEASLPPDDTIGKFSYDDLKRK